MGSNGKQSRNPGGAPPKHGAQSKQLEPAKLDGRTGDGIVYRGTTTRLAERYGTDIEQELLIRRIAANEVRLRRYEEYLNTHPEDDGPLKHYGWLSNSQRRDLEALQMLTEKKPKREPITLTEYLASRQNGAQGDDHAAGKSNGHAGPELVPESATDAQKAPS